MAYEDYFGFGIPEQYDAEAERKAAQKRVLIRRKARKIMFEIRQAAQADGMNLTAEQCKILGEAVDSGLR